jgi:hypothetical protein
MNCYTGQLDTRPKALRKDGEHGNLPKPRPVELAQTEPEQPPNHMTMRTHNGSSCEPGQGHSGGRCRERNKGYECTGGRRPTVGQKKYATKHMPKTAMRCHMHHATGKMDAS